MGKYAKAIVAAVTAGLIAAQTTLLANSPAQTYITIGLAALGALSVYLWPNATRDGNPTVK